MSRDKGVATVLSGVISLALLVVLWLGWQFGAATISRHRAEGTADLAALAAAAHGPWGTQAACVRAAWVVQAMGASVVSCRLEGWDALVEVRGPPSALFQTTARARAGPVRR